MAVFSAIAVPLSGAERVLGGQSAGQAAYFAGSTPGHLNRFAAAHVSHLFKSAMRWSRADSISPALSWAATDVRPVLPK